MRPYIQLFLFLQLLSIFCFHFVQIAHAEGELLAAGESQEIYGHEDLNKYGVEPGTNSWGGGSYGYSGNPVHQKRPIESYITNFVHPSDPAIVALAKKLTARTGGDLAKTKAIFDWVSQNISYNSSAPSHGPGASEASDSVRTLHNRTGLCTGYSTLTVSLLAAVGIPARLVDGTAGGQPCNHMWNEARVNGHWIVMDTIFDHDSPGTYFGQNVEDHKACAVSSVITARSGGGGGYGTTGGHYGYGNDHR